MFNDQLIRKFYITALSAIGLFLPLSVWMLTFSIIIFVLVWLSGNGIKKIHDLTGTGKAVLIACVAYLIHLIWMINTSNLIAGAAELKIKLPLLIFPLVIGLSQPLNKHEMKLVISFFITGIVISSITGVVIKIGAVSSDIAATREISVFISHIRLALMVNLALFASAWYFITDSDKKRGVAYLYLGAALWLTVFLFILLSLTGIIIFFTLLFITMFRVISSLKRGFLRNISITGSIAAISLVSLFVINEIRSFYKPGNAYPLPPEEFTVNGNPYQHFIERKDSENGNQVWLYINENELRNKWDSRSRFKYDSLDKKGQELRFTLIRYLTSMGLRKDSLGASSLTNVDVKNIENGITNRILAGGNPIKSKLYELIWQIDYFKKGGNPSGHSVTQRIVFLKAGMKIFSRNFFFGTGTGDVVDEFTLQYESDNSILRPQYRHLSHNQYLLFLCHSGFQDL